MLQAMLSQWNTYPGLTGLAAPPPQPIPLWRDEGHMVYIGNEWGPPVPYFAVDRPDGGRNHGYMRLKGNIETVRQIPEAVNWPELQEFLIAANAAASPIESVGCERGYFPANIPGGPPLQLGSYINLMFTEAALNDAPENSLLLASRLVEATEGCTHWSSVIEIEMSRFKFVEGAANPWGLLVRVIGFGHTEEQARQCWGLTLDRITKAIMKLPQDFRWRRT